MTTLERLGPPQVAEVLTAYRDALRTHRDLINRLNVYPVQDGDTGTNMMLTVDSVVTELAARPDDDMTTVAKAISHGSLMGARGNSGVILSQILRGLADVLRDSAGLDGGTLRRGLEDARVGAYASVQKPVEGTILTVVAAAARAAAGVPDGADLATVADAARREAADALAHTPDLLPVLAAAGVVDSGGSGFLLLLDAVLHVVDGRPLPEPEPEPPTRAARTTSGGPAVAGPDEDDERHLRYEVMYLLEAPDETIGSFRQVWAGIGGSIVVVGGDGLYNCHIHTADIGAAVEAALDVGRPRQIRVSDLWDQVEEERWVREAGGAADEDEEVGPLDCAVVAVCSGEGIRRIFRSLGVTTTVSGGQSMNPSTADLLAAIAAAPSDDVVVLPNNGNIVPVARQAAEQSVKTVRVVATVGIPEGLAALLEYDPQGHADDNADSMTAGAQRVVAGEVTRAVRASSGPTGPIREGDWLGISRRAIEVVAPSASEAAIGLLDLLIDDRHHAMTTLIVGDGAVPGETRRITEWLAHRDGMDTEVHQGGQPIYPYLIGIE